MVWVNRPYRRHIHHDPCSPREVQGPDDAPLYAAVGNVERRLKSLGENIGKLIGCRNANEASTSSTWSRERVLANVDMLSTFTATDDIVAPPRADIAALGDR